MDPDQCVLRGGCLPVAKRRNRRSGRNLAPLAPPRAARKREARRSAFSFSMRIAVLFAAATVAAPLPPKALHGWGTVGEMIFAHGGNSTLASAQEVAYLAAHYPWVTLANCECLEPLQRAPTPTPHLRSPLPPPTPAPTAPPRCGAPSSPPLLIATRGSSLPRRRHSMPRRPTGRPRGRRARWMR